MCVTWSGYHTQQKKNVKMEFFSLCVCVWKKKPNYLQCLAFPIATKVFCVCVFRPK